MPVYTWPEGIGAPTGDRVVVNQPLIMQGKVWFVSSVIGDDAAYLGQSEEGPFATLATAVSASSAGDIIVLAADHDEDVTTVVTISKQLTIVGMGMSAGLPTAKLRGSSELARTLRITAAGVQLRNIYFPENAESNSAAKIYLNNNGPFRMIGCYMECGDNDTYTGVESAPNASLMKNCRFENCTFVSTATAYATRPGEAIAMVDSADVEVLGCTFDGGVYGFQGVVSGFADMACSFTNDSGTSARIFVEDLTLLRGADLHLAEGIVGGYVVGTQTTGTSRVMW